jgi:hypothetical protein
VTAFSNGLMKETDLGDGYISKEIPYVVTFGDNGFYLFDDGDRANVSLNDELYKKSPSFQKNLSIQCASGLIPSYFPVYDPKFKPDTQKFFRCLPPFDTTPK